MKGLAVRAVIYLFLVVACLAMPGAGVHNAPAPSPIKLELAKCIPWSDPEAEQMMAVADVGIKAALSSVPQLTSRPGAAQSIYLDFDGDTTNFWGPYTPGTTPAYDSDSDPTTFSQAELDNITEIWQRVSEKFSPYNINVTTVDPGTYPTYTTIHMVIGGNGSWIGYYGGIAYISSFLYGPTTAFVFPANLANGFPKFVAEAAAHEAGHTFGLQHQSTYNGATIDQQYNPGDPDRAPIMGNSYSASRGLWWYGQSAISSDTYQDDIPVVSSQTNGFGLIPDDHSDDPNNATPLTVSGSSVSGSGTIGTAEDKDHFSFSALAGPITIQVNPYSPGGMLDASIELRDANYSLISQSDLSPGNHAFVSSTVTAGQYIVVIGSHAGSDGDIGQYEIVGSIVPAPTPTPTAPPTPTTPPASTATPVPTATPAAPGGGNPTSTPTPVVGTCSLSTSNCRGKVRFPFQCSFTVSSNLVSQRAEIQTHEAKGWRRRTTVRISALGAATKRVTIPGARSVRAVVGGSCTTNSVRTRSR